MRRARPTYYSFPYPAGEMCSINSHVGINIPSLVSGATKLHACKSALHQSSVNSLPFPLDVNRRNFHCVFVFHCPGHLGLNLLT